MKKKWSILIVIAAVVVIASTITGVSLAIWRAKPIVEQDIPLPIEDFNPSEKHFLFSSVDASHEFSNTTNYYAVVGYDGLVDIAEIPATYEGKPVTAVLFDGRTPSKIDARFAGNQVIRELIIPASVTLIGDGAFANCTNLERVTILGDAALVIGNGAFAGCSSLRYFSNGRPTTYPADYLYGTPIG